MKKIFTILCLLLLGSEGVSAQTKIGYTNGTFERTDGVRIGTDTKQGVAIKITKEKARFLQGKKIVGIRSVFGTKNLENLNFFITKTLGGESLKEQAMTGASTSWKNFKFDKPFVVEDEMEFYVGCTLEASTSYRPLAFDRSADARGITWAYAGDTWIDIYGNGYGAANLQLLVEDIEPFTDLCLKTFSVNGYYKAENAYRYPVQAFNFGTQAITGFDVSCQIGNNEPVVYSFKELNIAASQTFDFELPEYTTSVSGSLPVTISISNVNGADDADMTDNVDNGTIFIYPVDMKKNLLLEGFTGQECGQCPGGHKIINAVLEDVSEPIIEVFHHSGFRPDSFTMIEDGEYTVFYNGDNNYAPAVMINRMLNSDLEFPGPVINVTESNLRNSIEKAASVQPYVSVDIDNKFDTKTNELKTAVKVHTYTVPEAKINTLNVFIVQDSIIAAQNSGGNEYAHRYAFRGSFGSPWGMTVNLKTGEDYTYELTYTLPDEILSTYEKRQSIPTELKNMYLVAFVSAYSENANECTIYNSNIAKFTNGTSVSIEETTSDKERIDIYVEGNLVSINGEYSRLDIYDMSGKQIKSWNNPAEPFTLEKGFYIIRATCNGKVASQKVAIMK